MGGGYPPYPPPPPCIRPCLHSFIFLLLLSFPDYILLYLAWRLPLGVVKPQWNMSDLAQIIDTVFINPDIYNKAHNCFTKFRFLCKWLYYWLIYLNTCFNQWSVLKKIQPLFTLGSVYSTDTIGAEQTTEHNIVKNPNWSEANQLARYKRGRGFELGATEKQIQVVVRAGLKPRTAGLRVRHADHSATLPPNLKTQLNLKTSMFTNKRINSTKLTSSIN